MVDLRLRLEVKQTQKLLMTPTLQQAIKLLQLSKLELVQLVRQELEENPLLEELTEVSQTSESESESETESNPAEAKEEAGEKAEEASETEKMMAEVDWDDYFTDNLQSDTIYENRDDLPNWENTLTRQPSLQEHLTWQLRLSPQTEEEYKIGEMIIGNIDDEGYFRSSVEDIAKELKLSTGQVEDVLELIQSFDPSGVGARTLEECLLLQIKENDNRAQALRQIIKYHLGDIEHKRYAAIANNLKISQTEVSELCKIISNLDPKPGRRFNPEEVRYVVPDVFVYKLDDRYVIVLNDEGIPRLRVNNMYKRILRKGSGAPENTRKYIEDKFRSAMWLIKSIQQRQGTLYKVAESIVKFQRDFLDNGITGLKPLTLKDVARDIEMHESTVSRVTTNKYIHTPRGIYELKYFFHSGLESSNGGDSVSSERIKDMLHKLVSGEDKARPFTDIQLQEAIRRAGINIARRTVTKYREALNIMPSNRRRMIQP